MAKIKNKQFACGFNCIKAFVVFLFLFSNNLFCQDTVSLQKVEVTATKIDLSQIGKKTEKLDTVIKRQFKFNSIADVLSSNSTIFIKNYGPGSIATSSFRGGNASQTAVLWNGFNIQNPMLGQSDLALLPCFLFDNINLEYGGSSHLWGSGAVGGSIHLNNNLLFSKGLTTSLSYGLGSFGLKNASTSLSFSKKRFVSSFKLYNINSINNFLFADTSDKIQSIKEQKNASYNYAGIMNELKFLINSKQIISLTIWLNNNKRRLPSINNLSESKIFQQDYSNKVTANWSVIYPNHKSIIRAGYFNDNINYTDSLKSDFSKNNSQTFIAENENYFNWGKSHQFNFGVNYTSNSANSNNYISLKNLSRLSFLAGNKFTFFNNRWLTYLSIRADYLSVGKLPLTGNVSTEFNLTKKILLMASAAKIYRQPTLNELYWMPGGNINLKPEQGFSYDGTIAYKNQINNLLIYISGAAFTRQINNWILWTSSANGNPTPINLMQVWSRGTETTWRFEYKKNKLIYKLNFGTAYILSTTQNINQENNNSLNKQLIYTPRYSANAVFSVTYNKFDICFYNHYVGYRFTASDNSQWLNPYHVSSVRINYTVEFKYAQFILFSACNNLFNTDYKIVSGRPMPLRNFELGLTLQNKTTLK